MRYAGTIEFGFGVQQWAGSTLLITAAAKRGRESICRIECSACASRICQNDSRPLRQQKSPRRPRSDGVGSRKYRGFYRVSPAFQRYLVSQWSVVTCPLWTQSDTFRSSVHISTIRVNTYEQEYFYMIRKSLWRKGVSHGGADDSTASSGLSAGCRGWSSRSSRESPLMDAAAAFCAFTESLARSWSLRWSPARMSCLSGSGVLVSFHARAFTGERRLRRRPNHALQRTRPSRCLSSATSWHPASRGPGC